jgi:hypothetical protein
LYFFDLRGEQTSLKGRIATRRARRGFLFHFFRGRRRNKRSWLSRTGVDARVDYKPFVIPSMNDNRFAKSRPKDNNLNFLQTGPLKRHLNDHVCEQNNRPFRRLVCELHAARAVELTEVRADSHFGFPALLQMPHATAA